VLRRSRSGSSSPPVKACPHVPDYFLRNADGVGIVVDIRPEALIDAQDRLCFAGTASLCRQTGWVYRRVGELPTVLGANMRWLAGYRHERVPDQPTVARTRGVVDHYPGIGLGELAYAVGEPMLVFPTVR
jgi:hypothetical protein